MDNTGKSVIFQRELNTIPPFSTIRLADLINNAGKKTKIVLFIFTSFLTLIAAVILINIVESNLAFGFKPVAPIEDDAQSESYYTAVYNEAFAAYGDTFDITVNIMNEDSHELKVPMLTVSEIVSNYFSPLYFTGDYEINIPLDAIVGDDIEINVNKIDWKEYVADAVVEFEIEYVDVQTIPKGTEVTIQSGQNGHVTRTIKEKLVNGEYDSDIIVDEIVNIPVTNEIVYRGVGGKFTTPKGVTYDYSYYVDVTATAYGVDTGYGGDSKYTYTGTLAKIGVIAVDPNVIELGSKVYVTGDYMDHGICYADDIGGAILGNHIDIHLGDNLEAQLAFGVRDVRVYVLE